MHTSYLASSFSWLKLALPTMQSLIVRVGVESSASFVSASGVGSTWLPLIANDKEHTPRRIMMAFIYNICNLIPKVRV